MSNIHIRCFVVSLPPGLSPTNEEQLVTRVAHKIRKQLEITELAVSEAGDPTCPLWFYADTTARARFLIDQWQAGLLVMTERPWQA